MSQIIKEKMGGPYSKSEQLKRRKVNILYFEYGYSARKISELMKINRNTINRDIQYLYSRIKSNESFDPIDSVEINFQRMEIQSTRLRELLDNTDSIKEKILIEKRIFEVEKTIINMKIKIENTFVRSFSRGTERLNQHLKRNKKNIRLTSVFDRFTISKKTREKIEKLIKEDKSIIRW